MIFIFHQKCKKEYILSHPKKATIKSQKQEFYTETPGFNDFKTEYEKNNI